VDSWVCACGEVVESRPCDGLSVSINSDGPESEFPSKSVGFQELLLNKNPNVREEFETVALAGDSSGG
jgi:hypothetical protein